MFPVLFAIPRTAGLARAVGGDAARPRAEDRAAAADLHRLRHAATTCRSTSGGKLGLTARPASRSIGARSECGRGSVVTRKCTNPDRSAARDVAAWAPPAHDRRRPPRFDGQRALEHTAQRRGPRPAPGRQPGARQDRDYIRKELSALGLTVKEQAFEATTPAGKVRMVNVRATIGGAGHRQAADRRRPLRHQAVQGRLVRRGERRRLEHRLPDRAGARPETVAALDARRTALSRRRGGCAPRVASIRTTATAAAITSRAPGRTARSSRSPRWCWST